MAPLDLSGLGHAGGILVSVALGFAFGLILERAGFGNARKLAAQFYLHDQAVLKVMFTAIVVAMLLIFWTTELGWLDFERVWVDPTYVWPAILGGLLLGAGFILGGYCPGTSVVATATLKLDGLVFLLGCLLGIFAFGWTVPLYRSFWEQAGFLGRLTIPEWLGMNNGAVVLLVVLMALGMFAGAEWVESWLRGGAADAERPRRPRIRLIGAAALVLAGGLAVFSAVEPDPAAARLRRQAEQQLARRERHIEPAELLSLMHNNQVTLTLLDVREEADYNLFHLVDARLVPPPASRADWIRGLPQNSIKVVMSNDELRADAVALDLMTRGVRNVYVLGGGINKWLEVYGKGAGKPISPSGPDELRYEFNAALGARYPAADPDPWHTPQLEFTPKVKFDRPVMPVRGGCGG
jgi:rhodanese-related sulfurtransferase